MPSAASAPTLPGTRRGRVAVGIIIDGPLQEGWVLEAARHALAVPGARLCAVAIVNSASDRGLASRLHDVVDEVDRRLRCGKERLFAPVDIAAVLDAPSFGLEATLQDGHWRIGERAIAALRNARADLWLTFCARSPLSPLPPLAAMGVWGLEIGAGVPAASSWAGAAEVGIRSDVTVIEVVDYTQPGRRVVYRACGATARNSARRNRLLALRKAVTFYGRLLRAARRDAPAIRKDVPAPGSASAPRPSQTLGAVLRLSWRLVSQVICNRWRATAMRSQWRIGYYYADEDADAASPAGQLHTLVPPRDHDWADPFIVNHEGRSFIFFEDLPYAVGRAHIAAVEVLGEGRTGEPQIVLSRPYHLSYPFVFDWEGELYMIPESADNHSIELYRCEQFPHRWSLYKVLLENVRAYDSTLLHEDGRWWLFANVAEGEADPSEELHLYWSTSLEGPWVPHCANPVLSDVRQARGAGPLFRRDGNLYRPSQDCAADYGSAVSINRIDLLDTSSYRETPVGRIEPDRRAGMRCLHTFGTAGRLRVVDFVVRHPRWSNA